MSRFRREEIILERYSCLTLLKPKGQASIGPVGLISNIPTHEHSTMLLARSYCINLFRNPIRLKIRI